MKIVHMIGGGDVGGAKTHVLSLVSKLSEDNEVVLISFREGEFAEDARKLGINTKVINNGFFNDLKILKKFLLEEKFDIVHCHGAKANVMAALVKRHLDIPVITTVHSDYRLDYMGSILKMLTNGLSNTIALRSMDGYIGVTHSFKDLLIERSFDPYKLFTLNNGLDFKKQPSPAVSREDYLAKFGIKCTENTVVCAIAARFHPVKDIPTAIRAIARLQHTCPELYLLLGGDGEQTEMLKNLVKDLGLEKRVIFAGWIDDMDSFLNAVDISLITSVSEGFPYSVLESSRAKCTMISTAVGAMPEVIEDKRNGLLFDIGDDAALAKHLEQLYNDHDYAHEMADRLFKKTSSLYSFEAMLSDQMNIYNRVLENCRDSKEHNRNQVIICGSYGRDNAGDDAILKAIIHEIYAVDEKSQICVMSKNPKQTRSFYQVRSFHIFNVFKMLSMMDKSHLYINGGGSLIQDATSSRSLYFYLYTIASAHRRKCNVMMYGCGIGPLKRKFNKKMAAKVIDKNVDCITFRDPDSLKELKSLGVSKPILKLAADPTLGMPLPDERTINAALTSEGLDLNSQYLCLAIRNWKNITQTISEIAEAADYAAKTHGLKIALIPMEHKKDLQIAERLSKKIKTPSVIIKGKYDAVTVIGIISKMRIILAMRLHALVFGAGHGVSTIGIAYDHKVTGFMNYIGRDMCINFNECTAEKLKAFIDKSMLDAEYNERIHQTCHEIRTNEKENTKHLTEFFRKRGSEQ